MRTFFSSVATWVARGIKGWLVLLLLSGLALVASYVLLDFVGSSTNNSTLRGVVTFANIAAAGFSILFAIPLMFPIRSAWRRSSVIRFATVLFLAYALITLNASTNPQFRFAETHKLMIFLWLGITAFMLMTGGGKERKWGWVPWAAIWVIVVLIKCVFPDIVSAHYVAMMHKMKLHSAEVIGETRSIDKPLNFATLSDLDKLEVYSVDDQGSTHVKVLFCENEHGIRLYKNPEYRNALDYQDGCEPKPIEPGSSVINRFRVQLSVEIAAEIASRPKPQPVPVPVPTQAEVKQLPAFHPNEASLMVPVAIVDYARRQFQPKPAPKPSYPRYDPPATNCRIGAPVTFVLSQRVCSDSIRDGQAFQFPLRTGLSINGKNYLRDEHMYGGRFVHIVPTGNLEKPAQIGFEVSCLVPDSEGSPCIPLIASETIISGRRGYSGVSNGKTPLCLEQGREVMFQICSPSGITDYKNPWDDAPKQKVPSVTSLGHQVNRW